jgi:hypothetical protein
VGHAFFLRCMSPDLAVCAVDMAGRGRKHGSSDIDRLGNLNYIVDLNSPVTAVLSVFAWSLPSERAFEIQRCTVTFY